MSDTQVDHSTCAASGCNMLATSSHGTTGESKWLCFMHHGAQSGEHLRITKELQRLHWIVMIVRALRAGVKISDEQNQAFVLAQRSDLMRKESEARSTWMIRLEGVLAQSCKDSAVRP